MNTINIKGVIMVHSCSLHNQERKEKKSKEEHMRLVKKLYKLYRKRGPTDTSQNAYRRCNLYLLLHNLKKKNYKDNECTVSFCLSDSTIAGCLITEQQ